MHVNERPIGHAAEHARHDRLLVARFSAGAATPDDAAEAQRLVQQCSHCAQLADDMRILSNSIAQLPAPPRTRNFRLTEAQAEALRGTALDRFLRRLALPGLTMLRPVAGVALAMGLTVAVVGGGLPSSAGTAGAPRQADMAETVTAAASDAATARPPYADEPAAAQASAGAKESDTFAAVGASGAPDERPPSQTVAGAPAPSIAAPATYVAVGGVATTRDSLATPPGAAGAAAPGQDDVSGDMTRVLLIYGGVTLAMLSFGVLLLAWFARRRLEDPLLR